MAKSFLDVINAWPDMQALAQDVGENHSTVKQWKRRLSIPPEYWRIIEAKARERGIEWVTVYVLIRAAELRFPKRSTPAHEDAVTA